MRFPSPDPSLPFRAPEAVRGLAAELARLDPGRPVRVMHVCGTHEHAIGAAGLRDLLPPWLRVTAGPGCPVCVCPAAEIDCAARLAADRGVVVAAFGDVLRVPSRLSLEEARARGGDCRVVGGIEEAAALAAAEPGRPFAFHAVGFETTACTTAAAVRRGLPANLSILSSHRLVPPALEALLAPGGPAPDGLVLPGHVLAVTGLGEYEALHRRRPVPMAAAGFEPAEILLALAWILRRLRGEPSRERVGNAYRRVVRRRGNPEARRALAEVFEPVDADWRGLGRIPLSGLALRGRFAALEARTRHGIAEDPAVGDLVPGCRCGEVLLGAAEPEECALFGAACTPESPRGACMVAFEGTCHARFRTGAAR